MGEKINATNHFHFFSARLDFAIDDKEWGKNLQVSEINAVPLSPTSTIPDPLNVGFV